MEAVHLAPTAPPAPASASPDVGSDDDDARYTRPETPFALASTDDVNMLSLNWMCERADAGLPLPRRQDLPAEAFADVAKLRAEHAALPAHIAAAVLPMASVSYCWLKPEHPDGEGEQLRHIVKTLRPHAKANGQEDQPGWYDFFSDMGVFLDWCSIYQKDPALFDASETPEAKAEGAERAAFVAELKAGRAFYGGAAYEESRTAEQKAAFRRALHDTMDVWYAHQMIVTVFVTGLPRGFAGRTYEDRGWVRARRCSRPSLSRGLCLCRLAAVC